MEQVTNNNSSRFKSSSKVKAKRAPSKIKLTSIESIGLIAFGLISTTILYASRSEIYREKLVVCLGIIACVLILRFSNNNNQSNKNI